MTASATTMPAQALSLRKVVGGMDFTFTQRFMAPIAVVALVGHPLFYVLDHFLFGMPDSLAVPTFLPVNTMDSPT
mgnify:CR=1 FL=1